jgi:hypothetical protein
MYVNLSTNRIPARGQIINSKLMRRPARWTLGIEVGGGGVMGGKRGNVGSVPIRDHVPCKPYKQRRMLYYIFGRSVFCKYTYTTRDAVI